MDMPAERARTTTCRRLPKFDSWLLGGGWRPHCVGGESGETSLRFVEAARCLQVGEPAIVTTVTGGVSDWGRGMGENWIGDSIGTVLAGWLDPTEPGSGFLGVPTVQSDVHCRSDSIVTPAALLKIRDDGVMFVVLQEGGVLVERGLWDWAESWQGTWSNDSAGLTLQVGPYVLQAPHLDGKIVTGVERGGRGEATVDFIVVEVRSYGDAAALEAEGSSYVKMLPGGRVFLGRPEPEAGPDAIREYDLLTGEHSGTWLGSVRREGGDAVVITVGDYRFRGTVRDDVRDGTEGFRVFRGEETGPEGTVGMDVFEVHDGAGYGLMSLPAEALAHGEPMPPAITALFAYRGYEFFNPSVPLRGFFATVLRATKPGVTALEPRRYAAKVVDTADPVTLRELGMARKFSGTTNLLVSVDDFRLPPDRSLFGEHAGATVQIVEEGTTDLARTIRQQGRLLEEVTLAVADQISAALVSLHNDYRYVHADVKPGNLIGIPAGQRLAWRLADFNVTTEMGKESGTAPYLGGTETHRSPELRREVESKEWEERRIAPSADIWALGVVLIECVTGTLRRWPVTTEAEVAEIVDRCSPRLRPILEGCFSFDPDERLTASEISILAQRARRH